MKPRTFVASASLAVAVGALILLLVNVKATAAGGQAVACGTGFKTDMSQAAHDSNVHELTNAMLADNGLGYLATEDTSTGYAAACDRALSTRRSWGFGLLGASALVFVGALVVRRPTDASPPAATA
ncbi:hypothetical protein [Amycolatopsis sp. Hca4]|uniref:hypothetical protein n=1 Tax=Amycolatopsis sp. Hca4 TaxID=2742131 RepID=UPI00159101AF|nr:hypothetical protein [Amycolatopsis sp. Hca4]QKV79290.1 hypothetical protein HUT10_40080 [Amycolatopsis sp. Hca4]